MTGMDLATAKRYAEKLADWVTPYCERIEIAGSVRRQRPVVNDIDLVVIPRIEVERDLLGAVARRTLALHVFLDGYIAASGGKAEWIQGRELGAEAKQLIVRLPKCQLDIFMATEWTWATRFLARTGSKGHNIWLAKQAQAKGMFWSPTDGVYKGSRVPMDTPTEESIYAALGLEYRKPTEREM